MKQQVLVRDFVHYVAVFLVLLIAWVPVMSFFEDDIVLTAVTVFVIFIAADKAAHKALNI